MELHLKAAIQSKLFLSDLLAVEKFNIVFNIIT